MHSRTITPHGGFVYYFEDWVAFMKAHSNYSEYSLMEFEEHYQNLLPFEENTKLFIKQIENY